MENREHSSVPLPDAVSTPQPLTPEFDPWLEMEEVHRRMEALLHRTFGFDPKGFHRSGLREAGETGGVRGMEPDVDIFENEHEFLLYVALPGVNPYEIDVQANEATLTLTADIQKPLVGLLDTEYTTHHRRSRRSGHHRYHFAYRLPTDIRPEEIRANFRHGLLEMHLPKRQTTLGKPYSVPIDVEGMPPAQAIASDLSTSYTMQSPPQMREGTPGQKMGAAYTPTSSEDHVAKSHSAGARTESVGSGSETRNVTVDPGSEPSSTGIDIATQPHLSTDATGKTGKP